MLLAGLPIPDRLALELAQCLRSEGLDDTAEILEDAYDDGHGIVAFHHLRQRSNPPRP